MRGYRYILMMLMAACATSCVHDEKEIWKGNYQQRMKEYLERCESILTKETRGWKMVYYGGVSPKQFGAFTYYLEFGEETVTAAVDFDSRTFKAGTMHKSFYKIKDDNGAVLSFDTYNPVLHHFSEYKNSSNNYKGDFEFVIKDVTPEKIVMRGKRFNHIIELVPWEEGDVQTYMTEIRDFVDTKLYPQYNVMVNGVNSGVATFDIDTRSFTTSISGDITYLLPEFDRQNSFMLDTPLVIEGVSVANFVLRPDGTGFVSTDGAQEVALDGVIPAGYIPYDDYVGTYKMLHRLGSGTSILEKTVTLNKGERNKTLIVGEELNGYEFILEYYWNNNGQIGFRPQFIREEVNSNGDAVNLWMMSWDYNAGYWHYSYSTGLVSELTSTEPLTFNLVDNGGWSGNKTTGFTLRYMDVSNTIYGAVPSGHRYRDMTFIKQ